MKTYRWEKLQVLWTDVHEVNGETRIYLNINGVKFVCIDGKLYEEDPTITPKQREEIESNLWRSYRSSSRRIGIQIPQHLC